MLRPSADTIAAVATAPGRGAVGVVRVSGADTLAIVTSVAGAVPPARQAKVTAFRNSQGEVIDQGILVVFAAPRSYTGEDVAEFQVHGAPAVLQSLLERILECGARMARPGEFTERAFLAGKLDLAQAEAVADLIEASTKGAARAALRSLSGEFSKQVEQVVAALREIRALAEAAIDFPEEDIDVMHQYDVVARLEGIAESIDALVRTARQGRLLREGVQVVVAGEPNVGKSSLVNRLVGEEVAIVTDRPGTTRDALRASFVAEGVRIDLTDTAGLREADELVEGLGIERTRAALHRADVALVVVDAREELQAALSRVSEQAALPETCVVVRNKIDLTGEPAGETTLDGTTVLAVSAASGAGVESVGHALARAAGWEPSLSEGVFSARSRHIDALQRSLAHVMTAQVEAGRGVDLVAEELKYAESALEDITGWRSPDDVLGDIFSRFCIGK